MQKRADRQPEVITARQARLLLMHSQGLLHNPARRTGPGTLMKCIERMGFVQIDTIYTVARAHHLILHARFDGYSPEHLRKLHEKDRLLFEHMTHDASYIPSKWLRYWLPRFERQYDNPWWHRRMGDDLKGMTEMVLRRITKEGPLLSSDFPVCKEQKTEAWWGWRPSKTALEYLWRTGRLAVSRRDNFRKAYDLIERVHPEISTMTRPTKAETIDWACTTALERLMAATPGEISDFWAAIRVNDVREWCVKAEEKNIIHRVLLESADGKKTVPGYALSDWKQRLRKLPPVPDRVRFLAPFDPVLRDRARTLRIFGFDYRFEGFVPAKKRIYGYYVMPLLYRDRLIARADMKMHRDRGELEVKNMFYEPGIKQTSALHKKIDAALDRLADFLAGN